MIHEATELVDRGRLQQPLRLVLPDTDSSSRWDLQSCIDQWQDAQGPRYALDNPPHYMVVLQLERFMVASAGRIVKTSWACNLDNSMVP